MKSVLTRVAVAASIAMVPGFALAQSETAAAGAVPNAYEQAAPAAAAAPAAPAASTAAAQRAETALRGVITAAQGDGFDYTVFTTTLAEQVRPQGEAISTLLKQFGNVTEVIFIDGNEEVSVFRVNFENQATDWQIAFDADNKIAGLLFRPAEPQA